MGILVEIEISSDGFFLFFCELSPFLLRACNLLGNLLWFGLPTFFGCSQTRLCASVVDFITGVIEHCLLVDAVSFGNLTSTGSTSAHSFYLFDLLISEFVTSVFSHLS